MFIANLSNKEILKEALCKNLSEGQITGCTLDGLSFGDSFWNKISVNNTNANGAVFYHFTLGEVSFYRSNLMKTAFNSCSIADTEFYFDTLIGTKWTDCTIYSVRISQCAMQKTWIEKSRLNGCVLTDFEAIQSTIKNTIFNNCRFEITGGLGMNGFSGGYMENCLFVNCSFSGNPLRGVRTQSCVFAGCCGTITDEADCKNTYGLERFADPLPDTKLTHREKAIYCITERV